MKDMFCCAQEIYVCANNKNLYFCSDEIEWMEDPHHTHHSWHREIHCNNLTHMSTLENLIFSEKYSPSDNKTSLYLMKIVSALNCSAYPLVNGFPLILMHLSRLLRKWLSNSWYVPAWMHMLQTHIIWWLWVIFRNFGGIINRE